MRIAGTASDSIVDGPGLRTVVFTQGCPHRCPGCHNPETHDPLGGREVTAESLLPLLDNPLADGLTLSGGEPFLQPEECTLLARAARARGCNVWIYTGYLYEQLLETADPARLALLEEADVLVDGPFLQSMRSFELPWRGSRNQRLIDVAASRAAGWVILWTAPPGPSLSHFTRPES